MSNFRPLLLIISVILVAHGAIASDVPQATSERDLAIRNILSDFWGNARDVRGNPIQPSSEQDRKTVPVSRAAAYRALEAGNISGVAEWCGLDWQDHYLALTKAARTMGMIDKQVAFISVLHGAGQGTFVRSVHGRTCQDTNRVRAEELLHESLKTGLPSDSLGTW